ncbi:MAG TPA: R3H domain-containing nucleic acid-binding protein [Candidatus Kapabacteria bacterium]|nr:R3H domain-containing nucleic acid-binding protein [Candidatus Kapabacteria bacterium]
MSIIKEFCSTSLKEALSLAAAEFKVHEEKLKYEIITEKTKYFGHTRREIYIKAWPSDGAEEDRLTGFIKELLKLMDMNLEFNISNGKGFLTVDFNGEDYKLMLYQNGKLLNAVQYLLNRLYSDIIGKKIYCECERFRKNREHELTNLAHRYARTVRKNGKPISLKELNPFERRIIHMTINRYSDLESKSKGDSFQKVITIRKK